MKTTNKICQILAIVTCAAALVLFFFMGFATIMSDVENVTLSGAQLAFGSTVDFGDASYKMAKSADIWVCLMLTVLSVVLSAATFAKSKGFKFAAPAFSLAAAIYMLVITLSPAAKFIDTRPLNKHAAVSASQYEISVVIITILLFACAAFGVAHLLIADKLEIAGTKKPTVIRKVITFLKDYKREVKNIVWPNFKSVLKNTFIVLVICAIIGMFVWLLDWGLAALLELILGV